MAVTVESGSGSFSINYRSATSSGVEPWTEKLGYIKTNILDSAATDTTAVTTDLWNFAQASTGIIDGIVQHVEVTYTAELWGD